MVPNQLLLKLTQVSIGICHNFSLFQEISFPEGVRHFLGLMEQPPTPLITLVAPCNKPAGVIAAISPPNTTHEPPKGPGGEGDMYDEGIQVDRPL